MLPKDLPKTIGRYEVIARVGHGGMGVVYQARDPHIGRLVAVKLLNVSDEGVYERFLQEARSAGQLKHRNIVTIYDYGEFDNTPFIVMEFIEGTTLGELIRADPPLSLPRKLDLIGDLAAGLDYAHNKGVVHRDVKPANVMIDREGVLKILDFGLARVGESSLTQFGSMMGTPNYMSPEQIQGRPVDRRSDIFAVGLLFYELLSCRQAFPGASIHQVLYAITQADPITLTELCPGLDPGLVTIVGKAIEKEPSRRYQTLAAFGADVAEARGRIAANGPDRDSDRTAIIPPASRPASQRTPKPHTPRDLFARRRSETIEAHLETARRAFESGNYAAAVEAAEQAAILDPEEPRILDVLESARQRLDERQVEAWLSEAEGRVRDADLDGASQLVAKALQLDPESAAARRLRTAIDRGRQQWVVDRDAVVAVERARAQFAAGDHALALSLLDAFSPPHPLIARTRSDLMAQLLEIERNARELAAQRQAAALAAALARAEQALGQHAYDDALLALAEADAIDPHDGRLRALRARVVAGREEAWTRTKKVTLTLSRGVQALSASDFDGAERLADDALALEPANAEAQTLKRRARQGRTRALRQIEDERRTRDDEARRSAADAQRQAQAGLDRERIDAERLGRERIARERLDREQLARARAEHEQRLAEEELARATRASADSDAQTIIEWRPPDAADTHIEVFRPAAAAAPPAGPLARQAAVASDVPTTSAARKVWLGAAGVAAGAAIVVAWLWYGPVAPPPREKTGEAVAAVTSVPATVATTSIPARADPPPAATSVPAAVGADTAKPRPRPPVATPPAPADVAAVATTSIPPPPPVVDSAAAPSVPPPVTTTSPSTIATTSVPATTSAVIPSIERSDIDRILAAYAETFRRLDRDSVQRIYPTAPPSLKVRLDALKRDYSRCDVAFSNVQVISSTGNEAVVRADSVEVCRRKTAQPPISTPGRHEFHLTRNPSGDWIVGDLYTQ